MRPTLRLLFIPLAAIFFLRGGAFASQNSSPLVDLSRHPLSADILNDLETLGYRQREPSGIQGPDGKFLTESGLAYYLAAITVKGSKIGDEELRGLYQDGYRVEAATGRIVNGETNAMTRLELQARRVREILLRRHEYLERLSALLASDDPDRPLVELRLRAEAKSLISAHRDVLPRSILSALDAPTPPAALRSAVAKAYEDSTLFFDIRKSPQELVDAASPLPPAPPFAAGEQYSSGAQKKLGAALKASVVAQLSVNPVGRRILSAFRSGAGYDLPAFLALPLADNVDASFTGDSIILNQRLILDMIEASTPPAQRASLRRRLDDPEALARYLLSHPAIQKRYVSLNDATIAHELTHARQHRELDFAREQGRGNYMWADYLSDEDEAFLVEMRYVHEKMRADFRAPLSPAEIELYRSFISDFDAWRSGLNQGYLDEFPMDAASLDTGIRVQKERLKAANALGNLGYFPFTVIETFRTAGLSRGARAEKAYQKRYFEIIAAARAQYARMREEGRRFLKRRDAAAVKG